MEKSKQVFHEFWVQLTFFEKKKQTLDQFTFFISLRSIRLFVNLVQLLSQFDIDAEQI